MWVHPLCSVWVLSDAEMPWQRWIASWIVQSSWTVTEADAHDREKHLGVWLRNNSHPVRCQHGTGHPFSSLHSAPKKQFPLFHFSSPLSNWAGPWENPDSRLGRVVDVCRISFLLSLETSVGSQGHQDGIYGKSLAPDTKSSLWVAAPIILGVPLVDCWLSPIPACFKALAGCCRVPGLMCLQFPLFSPSQAFMDFLMSPAFFKAYGLSMGQSSTKLYNWIVPFLSKILFVFPNK